MSNSLATGVAYADPSFKSLVLASDPAYPTILALFQESATDAIIAHAGGGQASATALVSEVNRVTTVATAGDSVKLPASAPGLTIMVINHGANPMQVFGAGSDTIDDVATATGVSQMVNSMVFYTCSIAGKWYSEGLATGYAGSGLQTLSYADGITAAGTGQSNATPLTAMINNVSTVASGTGVNLPASAAGLSITVQNNGGNGLTVYPAQGASDTINGQVATIGVLLLQGTVATFNCTTAGAWTVQASNTRSAALNGNSATATTTLTAANITGGVATVDLLMSGTLGGAANAQMPTVAAMVAALHSPVAGTAYKFRLINASSANFAWTVTTNTGWTLTGTMSVAQNTWRDFVITLTSLTTAVIQTTGTGTYS